MNGTQVGGVPQTEALTPLPGAVIVQYNRCGKARCHCMNGSQGHGPYYYRVWRDGSRIRKEYVKPCDLERVRAQCALYDGQYRWAVRLRRRMSRMRQTGD